VPAAIQTLATDLGVDPGTIEVEGFEPVTGPDACLGAARPGEVCAQVETLGWRIPLGFEGQAFEMHTDQLGEHVRPM
jgi:hypothetical protein